MTTKSRAASAAARKLDDLRRTAVHPDEHVGALGRSPTELAFLGLP